jgi:RimJ/RimL family protein N-acetyltransferase
VTRLSKVHTLRSGHTLLIREASAQDAPELLSYVEAISGETDFLTFGPGEFDLTVDEEEAILIRFREADNRIYLVGLVDGAIVSTLNLGAGSRPRTRHSGEFGMSVRKAYWGLGIGSLMLDAFLEWARDTGVVTKVNLRVRTDNQRAIALYQRKGFVVEGTIRQEILLAGEYYDHHWMGLVL